MDDTIQINLELLSLKYFSTGEYFRFEEIVALCCHSEIALQKWWIFLNDLDFCLANLATKFTGQMPSAYELTVNTTLSPKRNSYVIFE